MNKIILILSSTLLAVMAILVNPEEIKMAQLMVVLVLVFSFLVSLMNIISQFIFGRTAKSKIIALSSSTYIWSALAMQSVGSGSLKDISIFSLVFIIAFFYIKHNFSLNR
ncbi:MAG: hypothetical protein AAB423_04090 [Patescibacteria group bacterium]